MKLKRTYEPRSLANWQAGVDSFIDSYFPAAVEKNNDLASKGLEKRKSDARLRSDLRATYINANGLPDIESVAVLEEPANGLWNISQDWINRGISEGWLSWKGRLITLKTASNVPDVELEILRNPGLYCVYCYAPVANEADAKAHIEAEHAGESLVMRTEAGKLPEGISQKGIDQVNNPAGFAKFNHFSCSRVHHES